MFEAMRYLETIHLYKTEYFKERKKGLQDLNTTQSNNKYSLNVRHPLVSLGTATSSVPDNALSLTAHGEVGKCFG